MSPQRPPSPTTALLFAGTLALPYAFGGWARPGTAALLIPAWLLLTQPTWTGLAGFYSTAALTLHAGILIAIGLFS